MHWVLLTAAIVLEVAGTTNMKLSEGFTRPLPSVLIFVFYGLSFTTFTFALKRLDLSMSYAIWAGAGTALIAGIGIVWFKEPINSMADFRKYRFRTPPGIPGQTYKDIGVASVAMGGGDILPALEKGVIDAAEWCCPKPDLTFGFYKILKNYYLQGLHQVVVNADMYLNGDVWKSLTPHQQKAMEVAADASLVRSMSYRIYENGKALKTLTEKHGVILHDTPADYFPAYMAAAKASLEKNAAKNPFFKKVWDSQKAFAAIAVPFWAGSQTSNAKLGMAYAKSIKK